ncbi:MAG: sulfite exporter TauE/SafE family protein [Ignavibacteria bacterium]|jgi:uncharacterized membrane protein YfcA
MDSYISILILFLVGSIAGFINVNAGGGSTLTLPTLIFLGLDAAIANGTNRIAIFIQNVSAIYSFKKENYSNFKLSLKLSIFTLPGAILGSLLAINLSNEIFKKILAIVMIAIIITMLMPRKKIESKNDNEKLTIPTIISMIGIGFYGGIIQVGVGFILMASLHYLMKLNLILVNMHKVFIVLIYTLPALFIFIITGNVNWTFGLSLAAGNAFGAWWAAKFAVKRGEKLIKGILIGTIIVMSVKLLEIF